MVEDKHHSDVVAEKRRLQDQVEHLREALESIALLKHDKHSQVWQKYDLAILYSQRALAEHVGRS